MCFEIRVTRLTEGRKGKWRGEEGKGGKGRENRFAPRLVSLFGVYMCFLTQCCAANIHRHLSHIPRQRTVLSLNKTFHTFFRI